MTVQLRAGTAVLWRGPGILQIGADPDHHVILNGLSASDQAWLVDAGRRASPDSKWSHDPPRALAPHRSYAIETQLRTAGFVEASTSILGQMGAHPPHSPQGDMRADHLAIRIDGVDTVTLGAAQLLALAGVRTFDVVDARLSDHTMDRSLGMRDYGRPRSLLATDAITRSGPRAQVRTVTIPDLVIVSRSRHADLVACGELLADDVPHLLVTRFEWSIAVGPLVVPGRTACAQCVALSLTDRDAMWPLVAQEFDHWPLSAPEPASTHVAALLVARTALGAFGIGLLGPSELIEGPANCVQVNTLGQSSPDLVSAHPRCGCGAGGNPLESAEPEGSMAVDRAPFELPGPPESPPCA